MYLFRRSPKQGHYPAIHLHVDMKSWDPHQYERNLFYEYYEKITEFFIFWISIISPTLPWIGIYFLFSFFLKSQLLSGIGFIFRWLEFMFSLFYLTRKHKMFRFCNPYNICPTLTTLLESTPQLQSKICFIVKINTLIMYPNSGMTNQTQLILLWLRGACNYFEAPLN